MNHILALDQDIVLRHKVLSSKKARTAEFLKARRCLYDLWFRLSEEQCLKEGTAAEIKVQHSCNLPSIPGSGRVLGSANTDLYWNNLMVTLLISAAPYKKKGNQSRSQWDKSCALPWRKLSQEVGFCQFRKHSDGFSERKPKLNSSHNLCYGNWNVQIKNKQFYWY